MYDLKGKVALVTGSTSGIGEAAAQLLASAGAHVIAWGRDRSRGNKVVGAIRDRGGRADFIEADLARPEGAGALARDAEKAAGKVDILVNNAGLVLFGATAETDAKSFDAVYALNVKTPFFPTPPSPRRWRRAAGVAS